MGSNASCVGDRSVVFSTPTEDKPISFSMSKEEKAKSVAFNASIEDKAKAVATGQFPHKYEGWKNDNNGVFYSQLRVCIMAAPSDVSSEYRQEVPQFYPEMAEVPEAACISSVTMNESWNQLPKKIHGVMRQEVPKHVKSVLDALETSGLDQGMTKDLSTVRLYFEATGANIDAFSYDQYGRPPKLIAHFLNQPGNNKLIYYSGHGAKDGSMALTKEEPSYSPEDFLKDVAMSNIEKHATITLVLDLCYAGKWAVAVARAAKDAKHPLNREKGHLMINLRMASLPDKTTQGPAWGGLFTGSWLVELMAEPAERGDGTRIFRRQNPRCEQIEKIWSNLKSSGIEACHADFLFGPNREKMSANGAWSWFSSNLDGKLGI